MDEENPFQMTSSTKLAETLKQGILNLRPSQGGDRSKFHQTLESSLQEISLRITQLCGKLPLGIDHQERRQLVQSSRESFQDAVLKLKENQEDISLTNALKGCIIALRAAEHVAVQEGYDKL